MTIANISESDSADLSSRLYGISTIPTYAATTDEISVFQYDTVGSTITSGNCALTMKADFELANFIVIIGDKVSSYWVNSAEEPSKNGDITTKNSYYQLIIKNKIGSSILIVAAFLSPTTNGSVELLNLM